MILDPFSHIKGQTGGFLGWQSHFWPLFQDIFNFENIAINPQWNLICCFNHFMAKIGNFGAFFTHRRSNWVVLGVSNPFFYLHSMAKIGYFGAFFTKGIRLGFWGVKIPFMDFISKFWGWWFIGELVISVLNYIIKSKSSPFIQNREVFNGFQPEIWKKKFN